MYILTSVSADYREDNFQKKKKKRFKQKSSLENTGTAGDHWANDGRPVVCNGKMAVEREKANYCPTVNHHHHGAQNMAARSACLLARRNNMLRSRKSS